MLLIVNVPRRQTQVPRSCAQSGPLAANGTDGTTEHAPPVHDDNENPDEILGEPKEVFIFVFLIY